MSRLAFRIQCSRSSKEVRISAAGFDCANELFLGPNALRWDTRSEGGGTGNIDGGITTGLYLWKPNAAQGGNTPAGTWYEISALGEVYHVRVAGKIGQKAVGVDNMLTDGWYYLSCTNLTVIALLLTQIPSCYS